VGSGSGSGSGSSSGSSSHVDDDDDDRIKKRVCYEMHKIVFIIFGNFSSSVISMNTAKMSL